MKPLFLLKKPVSGLVGGALPYTLVSVTNPVNCSIAIADGRGGFTGGQSVSAFSYNFTIQEEPLMKPLFLLKKPVSWLVGGAKVDQGRAWGNLKAAIGGGFGGAQPVLHLPLLSSFQALRGTNPTFSRAADTDASWAENDGDILSAGTEQSGRFEGARRVDNLARPHSDNLKLGLFTNPLNGAATDDDNVVTFAADPISRVQRAAAIPGDQNGRTGVFSATVSASSGSKQFRFRNTHVGDDNYDSQDFIATEIPQRFAFIASYTGAGTQLNWHFLNGSDGEAGDIIVHDWQYEDVTGQANINPSEYVAAHREFGANALGVRFFETTNANTLGGDGIVNEVQGSPLTTLQGVWIEGERTNANGGSRVYDSDYAKANGATIDDDAGPMLEKGRKMARVNADNQFSQVAAAGLAYTNNVRMGARWYVAEDTSTRFMCEVRVDGGTPVNNQAIFDWVGGVPQLASVAGGTIADSVVIRETAPGSGVYLVGFSFQDNNLNNNAIQRFYPDYNFAGGWFSTFLDLEQLEDTGAPTTPIITQGGNVRTVGVEALSSSEKVYKNRGALAIRYRNLPRRGASSDLMVVGGTDVNRIRLQVTAGGVIQVGCIEGSVTNWNSYAPGAFMEDANICIRWDGEAGEVSMAVDGALVIDKAANPTIPDATNPGYIVGNSYLATSGIAAHACLSDVRVWDEYIDDDTMLKASAA